LAAPLPGKLGLGSILVRGKRENLLVKSTCVADGKYEYKFGGRGGFFLTRSGETSWSIFRKGKGRRYDVKWVT